MPDLDQLRIDGTTYDLKDSMAREKDAVQDDELDSLKSAIESNSVTPEMFGAKGDGITNDTIAVLSAMGHERVLLQNSYYVTSQIEIDHDIEIFGKGTLIFNNGQRGIKIDDVDHVDIDGISIVLANDQMIMGICAVDCGSVNIRNVRATSRIISHNLHVGVSAIYLEGCKIVVCENCYIHDMKSYGDHYESDPGGAITGINPVGNDNVYIINCTIEEIHNVEQDGETYYVEDANGIFVSGNKYTTISKCHLINCGKRNIKAQDDNITISDIYSYNETDDFIVGIGIQASSNTGVETTALVENCNMFNMGQNYSQATWCFATSEKNVLVNNCYMESNYENDPYAMGVYLFSNGAKYSDCRINASVFVDDGQETFTNCEIAKSVWSGADNGCVTTFIDCTVGGGFFGTVYAKNTKFGAILGIETYGRFERCVFEGQSIIECPVYIINCEYKPFSLITLNNDAYVNGYAPYDYDASASVVLAVSSATQASDVVFKNINYGQTLIFLPSNYAFNVVFYPAIVDELPSISYSYRGMFAQTANNCNLYYFNGSNWVQVRGGGGGSSDSSLGDAALGSFILQ